MSRLMALDPDRAGAAVHCPPRIERRPHPADTVLVVVPGQGERAAVAVRLRGIGHQHILSASSPAEAVPHLRVVGTLCVAGVDLPGGPGLELLARARSAGWPTLALAAGARPETARAAMAHGIRAYLAQYAIPTASAQSRPQEPTPAPGSDSAPSRPGPGSAGWRVLTVREIEILNLVAQGKSNRTIAQSARISPLTVKSHLSRIGLVLGTGNRGGMVATALRSGLIR